MVEEQKGVAYLVPTELGQTCQDMGRAAHSFQPSYSDTKHLSIFHLILTYMYYLSWTININYFIDLGKWSGDNVSIVRITSYRIASISLILRPHCS